MKYLKINKSALGLIGDIPLAKITKFYFDKATYLIGDDRNEFLLVVDYKNNKFNFAGEGTKGSRKEVAAVARDLLKRKCGVNFADRI